MLSAFADLTVEEKREMVRDMDSLHVLPLSIIPLETAGLRRARLTKNYQLKSVIELYRGKFTGSGQTDPGELDKIFHWDSITGRHDQTIINSLAELNSYDVYSLRFDLRRLGIEVDKHVTLKLSDEKKSELARFMRVFTAPLLQQAYGDHDAGKASFSELLELFSHPNEESALANLQNLSNKLDIEICQLPHFLEEYADVFLSISFFKNCFREITPKVEIFLAEMREFEDNFQLNKNAALMETCEILKESYGIVTRSMEGRFESFDRHSQNMWNNLSAGAFREVRDLIESHQVAIGGVLCGLLVKMSIWDELRASSRGGLLQRAQFVMSHMRSGMDIVRQIDREAAPRMLRAADIAAR